MNFFEATVKEVLSHIYNPAENCLWTSVLLVYRIDGSYNLRTAVAECSVLEAYYGFLRSTSTNNCKSGILCIPGKSLCAILQPQTA